MIRRREGNDQGTSLIEVTIAMALVVMVMGSILGVFDVFTRAERRQDESVQNRRDVRQAVAEVSRDVRAASSIVEPSSSVRAATDLTITRTTGAVSEAVRFLWDSSTGELRRETSTNPGEQPTATRVVLARAAANPEAEPTFRYFDATGQELVAGLTAPDRLAACTTRVEITLTSSTPSGRDGGTLSAAVSPRNLRAEEAAQC
jgi:Tfp pilus assembly protein PilV